MKIINYIKDKGIKQMISVIYEYKMDIVLRKIISLITNRMKLLDIIIIESHNDFDCNGGALYNYLIENHYHEKYKIIWLLKNKKPKNLPKNVKGYYLYKPSVLKDYYICRAKVFTADNSITDKVRSDQKSYFLSHGAGGFKSVKGKAFINDSVDYVLFMSKNYAYIEANQRSMEYPTKKELILGYPSQDVLFNDDFTEIEKVTTRKYNKIFIWMPTFRKGGGYKRKDSLKDYFMGIPLIKSEQDLQTINDLLNATNCYMIIKLHPMQEISEIELLGYSNIVILTGKDVKKMNIDNYKLIKCTDAMISDYSGIAYEYLQLDRPIAYVLDDIKEYTLGFVVDDIHELMAGPEIYNIEELKEFIKSVINSEDNYAKKRKELRNYLYDYHDGHACERLVKHMGIN